MKAETFDLSKINLRPATLEEAWVVIAQMAGVIIKLNQKIEELTEKLNNNSQNSSKPPSSDLHKKSQKKQQFNKKRGARTGHKGSHHAFVPTEQVEQFVQCMPKDKCDCGGEIELNNKFRRHQVYEIPEPKYITTEYQIFSGNCVCCNKKHFGELPTGVTFKMFGAGVHALLAILTSKYRLSKSLAKKLLAQLYGLPLCIGTVSNVENTVSKSIAPHHAEVKNFLQKSEFVHIDETGCKQSNRNGWAWVMGNLQATLFALSHSRGKKIAKELIGDITNRIIISDRYSSYNYLPSSNRQLCWSHLKRDLQKISERSGISGKLGYQLLKIYRKIYVLYKTTSHDYRTHHSKTKKKLRKLVRKFESTLLIASRCGNKKTEQTSLNILDSREGLWAFLQNPNISATNNQAERQIRPLVIWRKFSFGTKSERGSRFVERIFTVISTCMQQKLEANNFLKQALSNYFAQKEPQSLLFSEGA